MQGSAGRDEELGSAAGSDGLVDPSWWRRRQEDYLAHAVRRWVPASPLSVLEHLAWLTRRPGTAVALDDIGPEQQHRWFVRIDHWRDCADFDLMRLVHLWYGEREALPDSLVDAIARRFVTFAYWYTEPRPDDVVDHRWYWSENHRLIFHTLEYLAGQAFPDDTFADGTPGEEHRRRAAGRLAGWFDEKAVDGFSEWHSDVYYERDVAPLITLVELADDVALVERATAFLDLVLFDVALHLQRGTMGSTHGRSYMKDKSEGPDQCVFTLARLCFDDTTLGWPATEHEDVIALTRADSATFLARATRYRPPEVVRRVAVDDRVMIDREHLGVVIDPSEPLVDQPTRTDGRSYTDPDLVPFWWDHSAFTAWQVVPLSMDALDRHGLWEGDLFAPFRPFRDLTGGDRDVARRLAHDLAPMINAGLLSAVDTYTWRSADAMLSTAQSYRPGMSGYQQHAWQATLDERALVFTTHPANEPWAGVGGYMDADHYWTGSATLPRSAQHGAAAIHQYAPAFASPDDGPLAAFGYLDCTHAFFPTEHFDEVVTSAGSSGTWTSGRRGDGYVALWSWRPVEWRDHDPDEVFTNGLMGPFDLVAAGGAANVWIVEVGDRRRWKTFRLFHTAVAMAAIRVVDHGPRASGGHLGFTVSYLSPGEGRLELAPTGPLLVDGEPVAIEGYPRFDNPWAQVPVGDPVVDISDGPWRVRLDLAAGTRRPTGPPPRGGPNGGDG